MRNDMPTHTRAKGQAVVEFALTATLIFFMLAAAVDLGLIFFTLQGLHNAAEEGATYGSRWLTSASALDYDGIRDRVRHEAGTGTAGFANLLDLNADGVSDVNPDTPSGTKEINSATGNPVINDYIQINALRDVDGDGNPLNDFGSNGGNVPCPSITDPINRCHLQVIVSADYNFLFPLLPAFGNQRRLTSSYVIQMRN
jgi:TadE-like protein